MVLGPAGGRFRGDNVGEPGHGDVDTLHPEEASLPPDLFEFKSAHHQGQVDLKLTALASHQRAA